MKKILSLIFLAIFTFNSDATTYIRTPVTGIFPTERNFVFSVQTSYFEKSVLDCASFIPEIVFFENEMRRFNFFLGESNCQRMFDTLTEALEKNETPCFEIEIESNTLNISIDDNCK